MFDEESLQRGAGMTMTRKYDEGYMEEEEVDMEETTQ